MDQGRMTFEGNQVREHLTKMDIHRSVEPDTMMLPQMLRELAEVIERQFLIIFGRS